MANLRRGVVVGGLGIIGIAAALAVSGGGRIGWTILGAIILGIVGLIPFVGGVVVGLAAAAVGAALAELSARLRAA